MNIFIYERKIMMEFHGRFEYILMNDVNVIEDCDLLMIII